MVFNQFLSNKFLHCKLPKQIKKNETYTDCPHSLIYVAGKKDSCLIIKTDTEKVLERNYFK